MGPGSGVIARSESDEAIQRREPGLLRSARNDSGEAPAPARPAGGDRRHLRNSRRHAAAVHVAARGARHCSGRRAGTHLAGMVEAAFDRPAARLLSGRGPGRPPLLDLSRGPDRRRTRWRARVVHAWALWLMPEYTGFSRVKLVRTDDMPPAPIEKAPYVELGVSTPFSFLRGASD